VATGRAAMGRLVAEHSQLLDTIVVVSFTMITMRLGMQYQLPGFRSFDVLAYVLTGLANLPLAARRRAPRTVLAICCAGLATYLLMGYMPSLNLFGPLIALYTVATYQSVASTAIGAIVTAASVFYSAIRTEVLSLEVSAGEAILTTAIAWMFGNNARELAQRNAELAYLTEQLQREQAERAQRAVIEDRLRIARELHDVVAHHMSVISVQAARRSDRGPGRHPGGYGWRIVALWGQRTIFPGHVLFFTRGLPGQQ
jgi:signal transduction histidine kinase